MDLTHGLHGILILLTKAQSQVNLMMARSLEGEYAPERVSVSREDMNRLTTPLREAYYSVKQSRFSFGDLYEHLPLFTSNELTKCVSLSESGLAWLPSNLREPPWHLDLMRALNLGEVAAWQRTLVTQSRQTEEALFQIIEDVKKVFRLKPTERRIALWPTKGAERAKGLNMRLLAIDEQLRSLARTTHLALLVFERWPLIRQ